MRCTGSRGASARRRRAMRRGQRVVARQGGAGTRSSGRWRRQAGTAWTAAKRRRDQVKHALQTRRPRATGRTGSTARQPARPCPPCVLPSPSPSRATTRACELSWPPSPRRRPRASTRHAPPAPPTPQTSSAARRARPVPAPTAEPAAPSRDGHGVPSLAMAPPPPSKQSSGDTEAGVAAAVAAAPPTAAYRQDFVFCDPVRLAPARAPRRRR